MDVVTLKGLAVLSCSDGITFGSEQLYSHQQLAIVRSLNLSLHALAITLANDVHATTANVDAKHGRWIPGALQRQGHIDIAVTDTEKTQAARNQKKNGTAERE